MISSILGADCMRRIQVRAKRYIKSRFETESNRGARKFVLVFHGFISCLMLFCEIQLSQRSIAADQISKQSRKLSMVSAQLRTMRTIDNPLTVNFLFSVSAVLEPRIHNRTRKLENTRAYSHEPHTRTQEPKHDSYENLHSNRKTYSSFDSMWSNFFPIPIYTFFLDEDPFI